MNVLFECGFETGNFSELDGIAPSGLTHYSVQSQIVHSGLYAAKLTILPFWFLPHPGVRLEWMNKRWTALDSEANLPNRAYYSAWYYLPSYVETPWLNLMQWKGWTPKNERAPILSVRLLGENAQMTLNLRHRVDSQGAYVENGPVFAANTTPVPVGEWFEITTLYEYHQLPLGHVTTWLNGQKMWDVAGIQTEFSYPWHAYPRQWTVNNYAGSTKPAPYSLYVDDLRVWDE